MSAETMIAPGFSDPVFQSQGAFRALLAALSEPGLACDLGDAIVPPAGLEAMPRGPMKGQERDRPEPPLSGSMPDRAKRRFGVRDDIRGDSGNHLEGNQPGITEGDSRPGKRNRVPLLKGDSGREQTVRSGANP